MLIVFLMILITCLLACHVHKNIICSREFANLPKRDAFMILKEYVSVRMGSVSIVMVNVRLLDAVHMTGKLVSLARLPLLTTLKIKSAISIIANSTHGKDVALVKVVGCS